MVKIKTHEASRLVVSLCDSDLQGRVLEKGEEFLDLSTTFFDGEEVEDEKLLELLRGYKMEDASFNIVGKESCEAAVQSKIIQQKDINDFCDVPMALVLL